MRISHEFEFNINEGNAGLRIDKALGLHEDIQSRSQATRLVDIGCVSLNSKKIKASKITEVGEVYLVQIPYKELPELKPYEFPLDLVYEDDDLIVVNKPSGLVVHPSAGHYNDTLVNVLIYHAKNLSGGFEANRPGLVHRIDKDTSGLLVVAKNDSAQRHLASQFKFKTVVRTYQCVCYGIFNEDFGKIESHLVRHPTNRKKFASEKVRHDKDPVGKLAITHYKVLKTHPCGLSLVELKLETGRTHQIRIHLSEQGHGILGDPIYGAKSRYKNLKGAKYQQLVSKVPRLFLHAHELGFVQPKTKKQLHFKVDWPSETIDFLTRLDFYE